MRQYSDLQLKQAPTIPYKERPLTKTRRAGLFKSLFTRQNPQGPPGPISQEQGGSWFTGILVASQKMRPDTDINANQLPQPSHLKVPTIDGCKWNIMGLYGRQWFINYIHWGFVHILPVCGEIFPRQKLLTWHTSGKARFSQCSFLNDSHGENFGKATSRKNRSSADKEEAFRRFVASLWNNPPLFVQKPASTAFMFF